MGTGIIYVSFVPENTYLKNQNDLLTAKVGKIPEYQEQIISLQTQMKDLNVTKTDYETKISTLLAVNATLNAEINNYENQITAQQQVIESLSAPKVDVWIGQIYPDLTYKHIFFTCILANYGEKQATSISFQLEIFNLSQNGTKTSQKIVNYDQDPLTGKSFRFFSGVVNYPADWDNPQLQLYSQATWK